MIFQAEEKKLIENAEFVTAIKETLDSGLDVSFTVTGMSMWPFFTSRRDSVTVKKCTFSQIRKGDIILFSPTENRYLLHRVMKITDKGFVTAGDGNTFKDGMFTPDRIIAKVSKIHRKGKVFSADKTKFRLISFIWIGLFPARKHILSLFKIIQRL